MVDKIARYKSNLWIQYPSLAYKHEVERYLLLMATTQSGRLLQSQIWDHRNFMVISPITRPGRTR